MKKTLLSFLCIGSTCFAMAQTTPSTTTTTNRNTTTQQSATRSSTTTPNSTLNNNANTNRTNSTLNSSNGTLNNSTNSSNGTLNQNPATQPNGTVNGHNTMMDGNRNYPGNSNMNNTPANSTLNGNTNGNGNLNNGTLNSTQNNGTLNNGTTNGTLNNGTQNGTLNNSTNGTLNNTNNSNLNNSNMNNSGLNANSTTDPNMTGSLGSTSANAAYSVSVPSSIQTSFSTAYPTVGNSVIWQQSGDWYRARYMENGKVMEASYREDGRSFTRQASPIMRTYVPQETMDRIVQQYGMNVYAVAASKGADGQNVYNVTLIENGQSRTEWMNEDGSAVMSPYRTEMDQQQQQQHSNMNSTNGQAMPATGSGTTDEDQSAQQNNGTTTPATTNDQDMNNSPEREPQTLEQGNGIPEVMPNNTTNDSGLNNGQTSDNLLRGRTDQDDMNPEE